MNPVGWEVGWTEESRLMLTRLFSLAGVKLILAFTEMDKFEKICMGGWPRQF